MLGAAIIHMDRRQEYELDRENPKFRQEAYEPRGKNIIIGMSSLRDKEELSIY